ncbi:hypothetical protein MHTCC0001_25550 [Flavobacteriaceae bacterium MHTCC 0001]
MGLQAQDVKLTSVDPVSNVLTINNPGMSLVDLTDYQLCLGPGTYVRIGTLTPINGNIMLAAGESVTLTYAMDEMADGLSLFSNSSFGSSDAADLIDYVQWGAGNQPRVTQAVTAGRWDNANNFVSGNAPYSTTTGGSAASWNACEADGGTLTGGPFDFLVGDGNADNIAVNGITLSGNVGAESQWVITDDQGEILGLPGTFSDVNFDGAGAGICLVWHLSHDGTLTGATMGANATTDLGGCYDLSNSITVNRRTVDGGMLTGGPFTFCVGDGNADNIAVNGITLSGNVGAESQWVITDDQGEILGLPGTFSDVNFDGAGAGVCLVWHLSHDGTLTGATMGANATTDLGGNYHLSNPITVNRNQPDGGTLTGGPFDFLVGDGNADNIAVDGIVLSGNVGTESQWVITDDQGEILGLPGTFSDVNFDGAGAGVCLVWHLSHDGSLTGATMGANATTDLGGCYDLSNPITVNRRTVDGGMLTGGPFDFLVGDGNADNIPVNGIILSGNVGAETQWVITDDQGEILGLPGTFSDVNFDGAGAGICLVWHLSHDGTLTGAAMGANATTDLGGNYHLSNPITVNRRTVDGGMLTGGPFTFCVGDGNADNIPVNGITLSGNVGTESQWVITDDQGEILGLPGTFSDVNFDGAGAGVCLVWHLSHDGTLTGATMGANATTDLGGNYHLSNPITVNRNQPDGGTLTGGPFDFLVGDGNPDNIAVDGIVLSGNVGTESQWVITDDQGEILGLPGTFSDVNFDGAGAGVCLVWHLSHDGSLTGATMGANATTDLGGCYDLSNPITVNRRTVDGGMLTGGPFSFCVGDGEADNIAINGITLSGNVGAESQWVITDDQGEILGLPGTFSDVNFDGAGAGVCLVWHLSHDGTLTGATMGANATTDLGGNYHLSNSITVNRLTGMDCDALSVNDVEANFNFAIYPNPTQSDISINYTGNQSLDLDVKVIDMLGKQLIKTDVNGQNATINLNRLTSGTYFLNITDKNSGSTLVKRIVKN